MGLFMAVSPRIISSRSNVKKATIVKIFHMDKLDQLFPDNIFLDASQVGST